MRSPFSRFQASDTVDWFAKRGVKLVAEEDGRMFPSTNTSQTVVDCLVKSALDLGAKLHPRRPVQSIRKDNNGGFTLEVKGKGELKADKVLIATGSSKTGHRFAQELGHTITELAPSLFTFKCAHPVLKDMAGTSFKEAILQTKVGGKKFVQQGALLVTHRGLSGPAVLKLSAWAAREMKRDAYKAELKINWNGYESRELAENSLAQQANAQRKAMLKNTALPGFTKRFWSSLLLFLNIDPDKKWTDLSKKDFNRLVENAYAMTLQIDGQNRFKEEFVECGGVKLSEVDFATMESKVCPNLYFSGEVLDVDGVTGGFNFQNAWTSAYLAARAMAQDTQEN